MTMIHSVGFYLHILVGSMALLLVWLPMTVKKGSLDHRKFGRYYHQTMMIVAATGALIATIVIVDPVLIHGQHLQSADQQERFISRMRVFYSLLLYLSLLVYVGLEQGQKVLMYKQHRASLVTWRHLLPNGVLLIASVPLFIAGWFTDITLAMIFPFLGGSVAFGHIRYATKSQVTENEWLLQHLGAYIGTAIGAYTAFIAFGGRTLLADIGQWQLLFWILPGVIGSLVIRYFSQKYGDRAISS